MKNVNDRLWVVLAGRAAGAPRRSLRRFLNSRPRPPLPPVPPRGPVPLPPASDTQPGNPGSPAVNPQDRD